MQHRHLNHQGLTLAAIDDIIARGHRVDWEALRDAMKRDAGLVQKVWRVCQPRLTDPHAQRYHFWNHYAEARRTA